MKKNNYLEELCRGAALSRTQQLQLITSLSIPAIFAQISTVVMEYADQSMVGRLGAVSSAAIGLVASSTWLVSGLCQAAGAGFTVQVAHRIGAGKEKEARALVRHGLFCALFFSVVLSGICLLLSGYLPVFLGGSEKILGEASRYFLVFALSLPFIQLSRVSAGMLQCSGNMKTPSTLNILACILNVIFNWLLIFPSGKIDLLGKQIFRPGAGLGVTGAALGTALSNVIIALLLLWFLLKRSPALHLRKEEPLPLSGRELRTAIRIAVPVGVEQAIMGGGYVLATRIISPLGNIALAAHSFAVTAESLCYMPGYGIEAAVTTIVGQSLGANRKKEAQHLAWFTIGFGMLIMTGTGVLLFLFAPQLMRLLSPDPEICALGSRVLRLEAFAEPMFAASIVGSGVFRGAGDTLGPSMINFCSMWAIRLTMGAFLAPRFGLMGMWIAMFVDLWVRGALFLLRLKMKPVSGSAL